MGEDLVDRRAVGDQSDEHAATATVGTLLKIFLKDALDESGPSSLS